MTIEYIFHSCFVVESQCAVVVYDYWRDRADGRLHRLLAATEKQVYFVVSHFHPDHYSPAILRWQQGSEAAPDGKAVFVLRKAPIYLLSYDVVKRRHVDAALVAAVLRPGHGYADGNLSLQAYRSTDIGVSTCATFHHEPLAGLGDGPTVFHCGDLNNWYFPADGSDDEAHLKVSTAQMEGLFLAVVRELQVAHPVMDCLMFPLDPRLGNGMLRGAAQWLSKIAVRHFYPMHYWNLYSDMVRGLHRLAEEYPSTCFHQPEDMPESHDALSGYLTSL